MGNDHGAQSLMLGSHGDMRGPPPATMAAGGQGSRGRPSFHADYSSRERPVGPRLPRAGPPGGCSFSSTPSSSAQEGESGGPAGERRHGCVAWVTSLCPQFQSPHPSHRRKRPPQNRGDKRHCVESSARK